MRRIRYQVAASLDGFIAGPNGEFDWIPPDPDIDFKALFAQFDTFLVGRHTFATMPPGSLGSGVKVLVFSQTLQQDDYPDVTVVSGDIERTLNELRAQPGKDIWLFGGGELFRSLLEMGQVDTVEIAVVPVLLGGGIRLLPDTPQRTSLKLTGQRIYEKSGIALLEYDVQRTQPSAKKRKPRRGKAQD